VKFNHFKVAECASAWYQVSSGTKLRYGVTALALTNNARAWPLAPVCTENVIRFDPMTESLNYGRDGRTNIASFETGRLALQVQEPT
jgi:hypothetical protein